MLKFLSRLFKKESEKSSFDTVNQQLELFVINRPIDRIRFKDFYNLDFSRNEFYHIDLKKGMIFFIDISDDFEYSEYLNKNFDFIKDKMNARQRNFIYDIEFLLEETYDVSYYYPFVKEKIKLDNSKIESNSLLDLIGYKGNITTGFLSVNNAEMVFIGKKENESIQEFVSSYLLVLADYKKQTNTVFFSVDSNSESYSEPDILIDQETKEILEAIEINLQKLKESGKFFLLAPKVEQIVKKFFVNENNITNQISPVFIDCEYKITLPDYGFEIKLSHLTKAIYILFLKHPEGIHLKESYKYKDELLSLYKEISYQISLEKIENSITDLLENEKAIFVHLSRIKSEFLKKCTDSYASYYYITGEKAKPKFIKLPQNKVFFLK